MVMVMMGEGYGRSWGRRNCDLNILHKTYFQLKTGWNLQWGTG